ncbi:hypothetical protein FPCIR_13041 [Fusarium pseudocircinatum]|uniref:SnoaL-like domain-containing protein n=1 Tax=Fusarium pseudocircinatum TaxID=56676 RepID=A0A8H5KLV0_9HYPO|nr:hypothetical protein FPCIR_13041 [Fusarium pseudocircinatum]
MGSDTPSNRVLDRNTKREILYNVFPSQLCDYIAMSHTQAIHRFVEFINSADAVIGSEVIHESAEFHVPFDSKPLEGVSGYLEMLGMMRAAFPDIQWSVDQIITEGDKVVLRSKTRGTQTGLSWDLRRLENASKSLE